MESENKNDKPKNCLKVVLFGPESTGKTTLSRQLAAHYKTVWVPEFARDYLQQKWDNTREICSYEDIIPIARGQLALEQEGFKKANNILFCDTDVLETSVYSEAYFNNKVPGELLEYLKENNTDFYFLTYIDTPWVPDDLRDKPNEREAMFSLFKKALQKSKKPYIVLKGNRENRFRIAKQTIDQLTQT
ncbi:ATP-binding protein [Aquimarina sp. ERC-38]|uniref:ATP-binding protein n=1 Tax=Aquimarina sp. ERC-38 TaxID=2949996 RepID=UPI0022475300|nr:ATP-binding protein [Aquimarina sp. ERC-38]UZO81601.1 ATP-binding protein [Aquimarina sp. ERC-38]